MLYALECFTDLVKNFLFSSGKHVLFCLLFVLVQEAFSQGRWKVLFDVMGHCIKSAPSRIAQAKGRLLVLPCV